MRRHDQPAPRRGRFTGRTPLIATEGDGGKRWCRFCWGRVRSPLGDVCSKPRCQQRAALGED